MKTVLVLFGIVFTLCPSLCDIVIKKCCPFDEYYNSKSNLCEKKLKDDTSCFQLKTYKVVHSINSTEVEEKNVNYSIKIRNCDGKLLGDNFEYYIDDSGKLLQNGTSQKYFNDFCTDFDGGRNKRIYKSCNNFHFVFKCCKPYEELYETPEAKYDCRPRERTTPLISISAHIKNYEDLPNLKFTVKSNITNASSIVLVNESDSFELLNTHYLKLGDNDYFKDYCVDMLNGSWVAIVAVPNSSTSLATVSINSIFQILSFIILLVGFYFWYVKEHLKQNHYFFLGLLAICLAFETLISFGITLKEDFLQLEQIKGFVVIVSSCILAILWSEVSLQKDKYNLVTYVGITITVLYCLVYYVCNRQISRASNVDPLSLQIIFTLFPYVLCVNFFISWKLDHDSNNSPKRSEPIEKEFRKNLRYYTVLAVFFKVMMHLQRGLGMVSHLFEIVYSMFGIIFFTMFIGFGPLIGYCKWRCMEANESQRTVDDNNMSTLAFHPSNFENSIDSNGNSTVPGLNLSTEDETLDNGALPAGSSPKPEIGWKLRAL